MHVSRFWSDSCLIAWQMATTTHPIPPPAVEHRHDADAASAAELAAEQALVPSPPKLEADKPMALGAAEARLPVELDVAVPIRQFRVRNLLALLPGQVIETQWGNGEDMPLGSGAVQLAWSEFEVIDELLAVRITRLA